MVRKLFILAVLVGLFHSEGYACDVCGSSLSGNGLGLVAAYRYNFVGMSWGWTPFQGSLMHGSGAIDDFHRVELSMRYHLTDNFKILAYQPYQLNVRTLNGETSSLQGIGDTRILANYTFVKDKTIKGFKCYGELGAGTQMPIGKYDSELHQEDLPENFNIGRGSWSAIVQPNFIVTKNNFGSVISGNYQYSFKTPTGYQFGRQLSGQWLFFYKKNVKKATLTPYIGLTGERLSQDKYDTGMNVSGTGGQGVFATGGLNAKVRSWLVSVAYSPVLHQMYSYGEVIAKGRLTTQVIYTF